MSAIKQFSLTIEATSVKSIAREKKPEGVAEERAALRIAYLNLLNDGGDEPDMESIKDELIMSAKIIKSVLEKELTINESTEEDSKEIKIWFDGEMKEFPIDQECIIFGRKKGCNVIPNNTKQVKMLASLSRIHMILFPLPKVRKVLLIDIGSLCGIYTPGGNYGMGPSYILPFYNDCHRRFVLGAFEGILMPKECTICMDRPRLVKFHCRHSVCCDICARMITKCPICRQNISELPKRIKDDGALSLGTNSMKRSLEQQEGQNKRLK
jgi:hypothetical protein